MKILILLLAVCLFSCSNSDKQIKVYEDSARYYSTKWSALVDSGFSKDDSTREVQKGRAFIYETLRKHYIDKAKELK